MFLLSSVGSPHRSAALVSMRTGGEGKEVCHLCSSLQSHLQEGAGDRRTILEEYRTQLETYLVYSLRTM